MTDSAKLAAPGAGAAPAKSGGGAGKLITLEVRYFKVPSLNRIRWRLFAVVLLRGRPPETNRRRAEGRRVSTGLRLTRRGVGGAALCNQQTTAPCGAALMQLMSTRRRGEAVGGVAIEEDEDII